MKKVFTWLKHQGQLRGLKSDDFARGAAHFLAELNAIHPFRDGNGRAQLAFMALLAAQAGHTLHIRRIKQRPFLAAMVASFNGDERLLVAELKALLER